MTILIDPRLRLTLMLVVALAMTGCYNRSLADRNTIGCCGEIRTLSRVPAPDVPTDIAPSVHSLARLDWQPIDFMVPVDGTVHGPQRRIDLRYLSASSRHRFLYPTAESALDLSADRRGRRIEGAAAPVVGLFNVFTMPINLFRDPPGSYMSPSKAMLYKRYRPGGTLAGTIPQFEPSPEQPQSH